MKATVGYLPPSSTLLPPAWGRLPPDADDRATEGGLDPSVGGDCLLCAVSIVISQSIVWRR